jgi:hypothetical protein
VSTSLAQLRGKHYSGLYLVQALVLRANSPTPPRSAVFSNARFPLHTFSAEHNTIEVRPGLERYFQHKTISTELYLVEIFRHIVGARSGTLLLLAVNHPLCSICKNYSVNSGYISH